MDGESVIPSSGDLTKISTNYRIGDCLSLMHEMADSSVDLVCTDPPYGYSFMGKDWDKAVPSTDVWKECLRVLKPGAFAFVMSAPRQDVLSRMICNIGDAGFDTSFTSIYWTYASGFPKAMNIGKAVDRALGAERETTRKVYRHNSNAQHQNRKDGGKYDDCELPVQPIPASNEAKSLDGSYAGFQPKPAVEVIIVAMKPLREKTYLSQAMANGKGVTWLDACRVPFKSEDDQGKAKPWGQVHPERGNYPGWELDSKMVDAPDPNAGGRFPANLLVSDDVLNNGEISESKRSERGNLADTRKGNYASGNGKIIEDSSYIRGFDDSGSFSRYFDLDAWFSKKVEALPDEVKATFPFLICPKADQGEKNKGLNKLPVVDTGSLSGRADGSQGAIPKSRNIHPTVKPLALMSWLVTLGCREGDLVLDPYLGSGTTLVACRLLMRSGLGFEMQKEYEPLIKSRLGWIPMPLEAFYGI